MKVELLVSEWCPTCPAAEAVWRTVAREKAIEFAVLDLAQPEGRELAHRVRAKSVPSVVVDGALAGVGVPTLAAARELVSAAPARTKASPLHAGLTLSVDNRCFVTAGMTYLILSAAWLAWHGALITEGPARMVGMHLFGIGFTLSLIYGLAAHMLPRFTGNPIAMGAWPWSQLAALNGGLLLLLGTAAVGTPGTAFAGALLIWLSLVIFAWRVWPVLWPGATGRYSGT